MAVTPGHFCKICIGTVLQRLLLSTNRSSILPNRRHKRDVLPLKSMIPYNGVRVLVAKVVQSHAGKRIISACHRHVR